MELRVLRYFLMTAREENITRAAELLHVTQPTLSRQLMQLEEELGVKLFHRGSHHIVLTEDGMRLKRRASEIVSLAERTLQEFSSTPQLLQGEISIGCGETANMTFLSQQMARFRQKHPQVRFNIHSPQRTISARGWKTACSIWGCCWSRRTSAATPSSACRIGNSGA